MILGLQQLASADDLPTILDLQRAYVEANGGYSNLQALNSMVASGQVIDMDDHRHDFKMYRKRPDKMRMQLDLPSRSLVTISDGERVFQQILVRGAKDVVQELVGQDAEQTKADGTLDGPFYQLRTRPDWLELVAEVDVAGVPSYEILIDERAKSPYQRVWIGKENQQEVKLSRTIVSEDGAEVLEEIFFSEFEQVRGVWLARHIRYVHDGEFVQAVQIDKVTANVGLFDSFFAEPKR